MTRWLLSSHGNSFEQYEKDLQYHTLPKIHTYGLPEMTY